MRRVIEHADWVEEKAHRLGWDLRRRQARTIRKVAVDAGGRGGALVAGVELTASARR